MNDLQQGALGGVITLSIIAVFCSPAIIAFLVGVPPGHLAAIAFITWIGLFCLSLILAIFWQVGAEVRASGIWGRK